MKTIPLPTDSEARYLAYASNPTEEAYSEWVLSLVPFCMGFLKRTEDDWASAIFLELWKTMRKYDPKKSKMLHYAKYAARHARVLMLEEAGAMKQTKYRGKVAETELVEDAEGSFEGLGWDGYRSPSDWG
jgi:hypothetical protein